MLQVPEKRVEQISCGRRESALRERSLVEIYRKFFRVEEATDDAAVRECLKIRYKVYCVENRYENNNAGEYETDLYDARSKHASLHHIQTDQAVGTVRMIYPNAGAPDRSFVLQTLVDWRQHHEADYYPVMTTGEISRFCVTKNFRKRLKDLPLQPFPSGHSVSPEEFNRVIPNMTLGLIEWLVRISVRDGLTHWCALMEPALLRLLARLGIHFQPIGDLVEFHGARQPCVLEVGGMLDRMHEERTDIWQVVSAEGIHAKELATRQTALLKSAAQPSEKKSNAVSAVGV